MKKYIVLVFVAAFTLFLCGLSLENTQSDGIVYAQQKNIGINSKLVQIQKVESRDSTFGPVMLPEVIVNVKRKVNNVI